MVLLTKYILKWIITEINMKNCLLIILLIIFTNIYASNFKQFQGTLTYKSNNYYYVGFSKTDFISVGDTLFVNLNNNYVAAMTVKYISSHSVACTPIINNLSAGINVLAFTNSSNLSSLTKDKPINDVILDFQKSNNSTKAKIGLTSYSSFDNFSKNRFIQRFRYYLSASEQNVSGSGINFSSYFIFNYRTTEWYKVNNNIGNALKVYDLNLNYNYLNNSFYFGRRINPKLSNIGVIDGLQYEIKTSNYYLGAVIGSRPNFNDFGFNFNLFQIGAFVERTDSINDKTVTNTISLFNQTNHFKTDRRFLYFQHSNNLINNVNLFISSEFDLFRIKKGEKQNNVFFTSFYSSINYSPHRSLSFNLSYDARKNIIYYETFKIFADSLFENEIRQGVRLRTNIRLLNNIMISLNYGYRFKIGDKKPNNNYGLNFSYYNLPLIKSSLNLSYNKIISYYLDASNIGSSLSRDLFNGLINFNFNYRYFIYKFTLYNGTLKQNVLGIDLSTYLTNSFYAALSYQGIFENKHTYGTINISINKKF